MEYGPLLGCAIGVVCMVATGRGAYESMQRSRWQKTTGRVLRVYVSETTAGSVVTYSGCVEDRYTHHGIPRTGHRHCCPSTRSKQKADNSVLPYSKNQLLDVYVYAPRPANSTLNAAFDPAEAGIFCVGAFFFLLCFAIFLSYV